MNRIFRSWFWWDRDAKWKGYSLLPNVLFSFTFSLFPTKQL